MILKNIILRDWKGLNGKFELSGREILSGPNGSGKSGIMDAVRVLIAGYTALGKTAGATHLLASGKTTEVSGTTEGGTVLTRKFERKGPGASQTITVNGTETKDKDYISPPELVMPVESIHPNEFLSLSGDKRAAWLSANLETTVGSVAHDLFPDLEKALGELGYEETVEKTLTRLADKEKTLKSEIDLCTSNLKRLMGQEVQLPAGTLQEWEKTLLDTDADLESLNKEQSANEERIKLASSKTSHLAKLQELVKQADTKIAQTKTKIDDLKKQLAAIGPEGRAAGVLSSLKTEFNLSQKAVSENNSETKMLRDNISVFRTKGCCPTCHTPASNLEILDEWDIKIMNLEVKRERLDKRTAELQTAIDYAEKVQREESKRKELGTEIKVLEDAIKSYSKAQAGYQEEIQKGESDAQMPIVQNDEVLAARIDGLRVKKFETQEFCRKFQAHLSLAKAKVAAEQDRQTCEKKLEGFKDLIKSLKSARDKHLEKMTGAVVGPFKTAIGKAFPGYGAYFQIIDDKGRPEVDFGIVRDIRKISFETLSGGEKLAVLAALVASLQIARCGRPRLCLLEMAEADTQRLTAVADACDAIGFDQVILATCQAISPSLSPKWHITTMGGAA